jgi:hypothetical protein
MTSQTAPALRILALAGAVALTGCPSSASNPARAQEAANELNLNTRFGRMELAMEHVAAKEREGFARRHHAWGGGVRIADTELAGMRVKENEKDAEITVRVAWYAPNQQELKMTTVRQRWKNFEGDWLLVGEERLEGDIGLLGEPVVSVAPPRKENVQFPTIRLAD